jgi:glycosyltransferase involved in cell wall biosynthesis
MSKSFPSYVLVTPARNEEEFIEKTLQSVVAQEVRPVKWVIVSDGSTDRTDEIVSRYAAEHPWIELVRTPERRERNFAGKVHAFNAGYAKLQELEYDAIGCLDGDISFDEGYFAFLLGKLAEESMLGLVGTPFRDAVNYTYDYRYASIEHVTGCCQLFRRECFEQIGGYMPVKGGSIDRIANIAARMKGWKTRTFTGQLYVHHRQMGTAEQGELMAKFKDGAKDYAVGNHPIWEITRVLYQMTQRPYVGGGLMLAAGYLWSLVRRVERPVPPEMVRFSQREQMRRLKVFVTGRAQRKTA